MPAAAAALGSMMGFKGADADKGQRAILTKAIETLAAVPGAEITVPALRDVIERQDDALLTAIGGGYPDRYFATLAERLLTLELNNRQLLSGGERLDMDALLGVGEHARPGRVRLSVISTRFLGEAAKVDFWVSQFLVAVSRWCAKSPRPTLQLDPQSWPRPLAEGESETSPKCPRSQCGRCRRRRMRRRR